MPPFFDLLRVDFSFELMYNPYDAIVVPLCAFNGGLGANL